MRYKILRPPLYETYNLPEKEELLKLKPGDTVKITFQVSDEMAERMWVILKNTSDGSKWIGKLDSQPIGDETSQVLKPGMKIEFHPFDIIQVE